MLETTDASDLFKQSYSRGIILFFYGLAWIIAALGGYILLDSFLASGSGVGAILLTATVTSALAGAIGGATAMLARLYKQIAITLTFQHEKMASYLWQPFIGMGIGMAVLYIVVIPPSLLVNFVIQGEFQFVEMLVKPSFVAIQILLSWTGGFYQREGLAKIRTLALRTEPIVQSPDSIDKDSPTFYKDWVDYHRNMTRWSYTWGLFLFFYGLLWLFGMVAGYLLTAAQIAAFQSGSHTVALMLMLNAWPAAAAGAVGGVFNLFKDLYRHISVKQDFHRQHLMSYLVQPVIGLVLGMVMYFLVASGYLVIRNDDGSTMTVGSEAVFALQLLLGWIAGFRQHTVTDFIQKLIKDIVAFFKRAGRILLNPKNWFDKVKRERALREAAESPSVFAAIDEDTADSVW